MHRGGRAPTLPPPLRIPPPSLASPVSPEAEDPDSATSWRSYYSSYSESEFLRSSVENLKAVYLDQVRRDELRHRVHRTTPTPQLVSTVANSLPNIAEAAHESSNEETYGSPLLARRAQPETKPSPSEPPPLPQSAPPPLDKGDRSKKVALYPTGTADKPVSEKTPVVRPRERTIFESKPRPTPPDVLSEKSPAPPQEDRVVFESQPLSPTHQPKSILKSAPSTSSSAVPHSGGGAYGRSETVSETIISSTSEQRMAAWRSGYEIVETSTHRPASTLPYQPSLNDQATMEREPVSEQMSATEEYYRQQEFDYEQRQRDQYRHQQHSGPPPVAPKPPKQPLSGSELELNKHNGGLDDRRVVVWPPNSDHRRRPASAMARSITDPDRIEEYQRQKQQEAEAIRHREEVLIHQQHKQIQALQKQQHRLYTQAIQEEGGQGPPPQIMPRPPSSQPLHHFGQSQPSAHTNHMMSPPPSSLSQPINDQQQGHQPLSLRVFETRPISSLSVSDLTDPRDYMLSPGGSTWKRSYVVDQATSADRLKNEIVTSDELLDKEAYYVDLLARRDAFVEKVELPPQV
uniref:Uncharacterized protein n=1 Tax=Plectus sambesii TaxID=2011161 RepID=A0A914VSZ9_9BILA